MTRFLDRWYQLLTWIMAVTVAVLIIPVTLQIFSRYTSLIPSYIWTEEMSRFFFVWMVMLGAMIGVRDRLHFDVDVFPDLSPHKNALLRLVANALTLIFTAVVIWWGIEFTRFGWNQTSELADLPMWLIFIAWPITGLSWFLFQMDHFRSDWRDFKNPHLKLTTAAGAIGIDGERHE
ncbi:MAG: TRAP transporter small permease [Burkholderiales bacterium]|nr:TRAP transporter small permease [Burkholderiales bacterium]